MIKRFFLNALSAFVGAWAAIALFMVALFILLIGIISTISISEGERLTKHSVLKIRLEGVIDEVESGPQFDYYSIIRGKIEQPQGLRTIIDAIDNAKNNSNIDALYIECNGVSAAPATLNALRNEISDFKKSGKRVFAYGNSLTMGDYFVASIADALYLNPAGSLNLQGISGTSLYYKDFLDKVGIDVEVVKVGSFKSAVEPYISNEMSEPAKLQLDTLYTAMWDFILADIAKSRKVKAGDIDTLVNNFIFLSEAKDAKRHKLVDDCLYERQVKEIIAEYVGKDTDEVNYIGPGTITKKVPQNPGADNQIAVLYAVGDIGEYEGAGINCSTLVPIIVKLAQNDNVKGLVLRVNSPGGSVFGSDQIGEALDYFKSKGKPLAVSMGDYAASGGYWISAGADRIFADPLTITGSIGIFGMVPNVSGLSSKLGIHPQTVSTNPGVNFPSIFYPMSEAQHLALQANVERGYDQFISRVANGRNKSVEYIKSIAEGRVWNAQTALKLGLVDQLGGLQDAVSWISDKINEPNYNLVYYPDVDNSLFGMIPESIIQNNAEIKAVVDNLKAESTETRLIQFAGWFLLQHRIQARAPYYYFYMGSL